VVEVFVGAAALIRFLTTCRYRNLGNIDEARWAIIRRSLTKSIGRDEVFLE
jgi:hypothetical protein